MITKIWNKAKPLVVKVIKTSAQSAIGVIGTTALISEVDLALVGGTVAMAAVMTVLMNLADLKET